MKYHEKFEWDPKKAKVNQEKQDIKFEVPAEVLADEQAEIFHLEEYDDAHSKAEDRHTTFASHPMRRTLVLRITWTDRSKGDEQITRIFSARHAKRKERVLYEKAISKRE